MGYCHEHAIPHSHFLGGPNEWTPEDRAKVVAYTLEKNEMCQLCGTATWEWDEDHYAYETTEHYCRGCELKELTTSDPDREDRPGYSVTLIPKALAAAVKNRGAEALQRRKRRRRENLAQ